MGNAIFNAVKKKGKDKLAEPAFTSALDIPVKSLLDAQEVEAKLFGSYNEGKKAILVVNVATN